jgi:23S rRNA (cytidine1920-2'-O)/16S rRNA (cytidine1409-2'-O)-methyltransferase
MVDKAQAKPPRNGRRLDDVVAAQTELTRSQARGMILAGRVRIDGEPRTKPGQSVREGAEVVVDELARYVSRGGEKLEGALAAFAFDPGGLDALDVGASTGGFTDCLLQRGAAHVTALDVGYGQLALTLRDDPRVTVVERTNFRLVEPNALGAAFDVIVIDASFISVVTLLDRARAFLVPNGSIVALVKPQFEAGRERLGTGGVVRDPAVHAAILREVRAQIAGIGLVPVAVAPSPLVGPAGNVEFFMLVRADGTPLDDEALERALAERPI